jgi:hypothetical protein
MNDLLPYQYLPVAGGARFHNLSSMEFEKTKKTKTKNINKNKTNKNTQQNLKNISEQFV